MSHQQKTLWTKDFTSIAIATILTAVGGEAMNLPISLLVFDETGSTFLDVYKRQEFCCQEYGLGLIF